MLLKAKLENLTRGTRSLFVNDGKQACGRPGAPVRWYQNQITRAREIIELLPPEGARFPDTHAPTPAREKSLNFFAFEQQQMGNWPINCCDDLGLPISAGSF